ncbi:bifunctional tetrahydrofolate synthase/dihydrofolate synthase [Pseudomarimonas arenosa]|uniref:bifunctional tetrahydrofolate synthase/dihydrofolate synthase n=1 Tax=Pseudomarimonas arenosa TaxID=2774145 RepID=UPI002FC2CDC4
MSDGRPPRTLNDWLSYQQQTHPDAIALGLERVQTIWQRLQAGAVAQRVITVAGTNGKGSTAAMLEALGRHAGWKVGLYTSPHLLRYNERVRVAGESVSDAALIDAFERIEAARGELPLTFFEWGTLAALLVFAESKLDLAVLEVGLGGRLDAVNIIDADVAVVTTVALDHMDLLGGDRESIGREKVGIARAHKPLVLGELDPPDSLLKAAQRLGAKLIRRGREFDCEQRLGGRWQYRQENLKFDLPWPTLVAPCQMSNAATALVAIRCLQPIDQTIAAAALADVQLPGRMQRLQRECELLLDVAHNPQAVQQLARWLGSNRAVGATHAVFACLADKDAPALVAPLMSLVDAWHLAGLPDAGARAHPIAEAWPKVAGLLSRSLVDHHPTVAEALQVARERAAPGDRIVIYGSFHTVAKAMQELSVPGQ